MLGGQNQEREWVLRPRKVLNRLPSSSPRHHLDHPQDGAWPPAERRSSAEKLQLELDRDSRVHFQSQSDRLTEERATLSLAEPWEVEALSLLQIPGLGVILGMLVVSASGDIASCSHPQKLVGYAGLGAGVHDSGEKYRGKGITKQGRKELRWTLVEAASPEDWDAVACGGLCSLLEIPIRRAQN